MYHVYRIWQEVLISHDQPLKNLQIQYKSKQYQNTRVLIHGCYCPS